VPDSTLCDAVTEMAAGLFDADLGGGVYKKRIPMPGRGKRGGARTIIGSNLGSRWFFLFGFEKNERATIEPRELTVLQKTAAALLDMEPNLLERSMVEGELLEICHEKETPTE
jgi:hypothetical protein